MRSKTIWTSVIVAAALGAASTLHAQNAPATAKQWRVHVAAATAQKQECYSGEKFPACSGMLEAYTRALKSPDADEQALEEILPPMIYTYKVAGIVTRRTGSSKDALDLFDAGQQLIVEHFAGGRHWHILFDDTNLFSEKIETLWKLGQANAIEATLNDIRGAQDAVLKGIEDEPCSASQQQALMFVTQQGSGFERTLERFFKDELQRSDQVPVLIGLATDAKLRESSWTTRAHYLLRAPSADACKGRNPIKMTPIDAM